MAATTHPAGRDEVTVRTDDLIVGRRISHPIRDANGLLLLAAGTEIHERFKQLLQRRGIHSVRLNCEDAAAATLDVTLLGSEPGTFHFDDELVSKLDRLIEGGPLFVPTLEQAVRQNLVLHGCRAYDPQARQRLFEEHDLTTSMLDTMLQQAIRGVAVKSSTMATVVASYLSELTSDAENVLTVAAEAGHDKTLSDHCLQMALVGMAIAVEVGLDARSIRTVGLCGLVHDWGMSRVPRELREAERILSDAEYLQIQKHAIYSLELLQRVEGIPSLVPLVCYQIHERPNGTGYPRQRTRERIHQFALILQVADCFVALTSPRPFRPPLIPYSAMECLLRMAEEGAVDSEAVRALLRTMSLFPLGSVVRLTDGSIAEVIRRNGNNYTQPIVKRLRDGRGIRIDRAHGSEIVSLSDARLNVVEALPNQQRGEIPLDETLFHFHRPR